MGRDRRIMGAATYNFQSGNFRYPCQPLLNQIVIGANENSQSGLLWIPSQQPIAIPIFKADDVVPQIVELIFVPSGRELWYREVAISKTLPRRTDVFQLYADILPHNRNSIATAIKHIETGPCVGDPAPVRSIAPQHSRKVRAAS